MRMKGKVAIVAGAAGGIGQAIATLFAREGACNESSYVTGAELLVDGGQTAH